jgi:hypothetical protein
MTLNQVAPTRFYSIPDGAAGTRETLKAMRDEVCRQKRSTWIRHVAQRIVRRVPAKDWLGEIEAVFRFVQHNVRYSLDVNGIEVVQSAPVTLRLGYGDCDDFCVALATLLECLGHVCYFCALGFDECVGYSHVVVLCSGAGETELVPLDATEERPAGWFPPGVTCAMVAAIEVD